VDNPAAPRDELVAPKTRASVEAGTLDRVKNHSNDEAEKGEFFVDSKEAGSVTGLHHVLKPGESDPAFATIKARGDATVRKRWRRAPAGSEAVLLVSTK